MTLVFLAIFVLGVLAVAIWSLLASNTEARTSNLETRTDNLETRTDNLETNVSSLNSTTDQSLAFLRKMNSTIDVITDGLSLVVPDPITSAIETRQQQGGPRGVSGEFHF